jgi:hypothetical protein
MDTRVDGVNDYIINQVLLIAKPSMIFSWQEIINKILKDLPSPLKSDTIELKVYEYSRAIDDYENKFSDILAWFKTEGYIEPIEQTAGKYLLTQKGLKLKEAGNRKKYYSYIRWAKFKSRSRDFILIWLFPSITIWLLALQTCNNSINIKNPVKVIIDSVPKECCIDKKSKTDSNTTPQPINDSSNQIPNMK